MSKIMTAAHEIGDFVRLHNINRKQSRLAPLMTVVLVAQDVEAKGELLAAIRQECRPEHVVGRGMTHDEFMFDGVKVCVRTAKMGVDV